MPHKQANNQYAGHEKHNKIRTHGYRLPRCSATALKTQKCLAKATRRPPPSSRFLRDIPEFVPTHRFFRLVPMNAWRIDSCVPKRPRQTEKRKLDSPTNQSSAVLFLKTYRSANRPGHGLYAARHSPPTK